MSNHSISGASSDSEANLNDKKEKSFQSYIKKLLQGRVFVGDFKETLLVDSIKLYRNVIVVNGEETKLIRDLAEAQTRAKIFYGYDHWIGISNGNIPGGPRGMCLWVQLSEEILGSFFYQIRKVKFRSNEVLLCLDALRPINLETSTLHSSNSSVTTVKSKLDKSSILETSFEDLVQSFKVNVFNFRMFLNTVVTRHNIKESIKFSFFLLVALFAASLKFVEFLGDYSIKLLREFSNIIRASTPIMLATIDLISRIVGGFYLLVLGMWRGSTGPPIRNPRIGYNNRQQKMLM